MEEKEKIKDPLLMSSVLNKEKEKKDEIRNNAAYENAVLADSFKIDNTGADIYLLMMMDDETKLSEYKDANDNLIERDLGGSDYSLNSEDYYWGLDAVKERWKNDKTAFELSYKDVLSKKNLIDGLRSSDMSMRQGSVGFDMGTETSFMGKGSLQYGEEKNDSMDIQQAAPLSIRTEDGDFYNTKEIREKYNNRFKFDKSLYSADPYAVGETYIEPFAKGDELLGYDVVSKWNLENSFLATDKAELDLSEYWELLPKTFMNSTLAVAGGIADLIQSTLYSDQSSDAYKALTDFKNTLEYYKVGSTTLAHNEGPLENMESLVDSTVNVFGQVGVAMGAAFLTKSLGPVISNLAARVVYTATVLDGTRKEALEAGMSHDAANIYTMSSAAGFYLASGLSQYAWTANEVRAMNKEISGLINKSAVNYAGLAGKKVVGKESTNALVKAGQTFGKKLGDAYKKVSKANLATEGIAQESTEEFVEEIFQETSRQLTNFYEATNNAEYPTYEVNKGRFATFGDKDFISNVAGNLGTSALLGGLGGGVIGGAKSLMGHKLADVDKIKKYSDIVRKGKEKEFVRALNKSYESGGLGSKSLSFKTDKDGNYEVAKDKEDSQAMFNYQLILNNLSTVKESLGEMGAVFTDPKFEEDNVVLSERSSELTENLLTLYSKYNIGDSEIKDITDETLDEFNKVNKKEISTEDLANIHDTRKKLKDIKDGREHVHFFIKEKIKDSKYFGDNKNPDVKSDSDFLYEEALQALTKVKSGLQNKVDIQIKESKINDAEVKEFIELHGDKPVTSLESFKDGNVILLSASSIKAVIEHNEKFLKEGVKEFAESYEAKALLQTPWLIENQSIARNYAISLLESDITLFYANKKQEVLDSVPPSTEGVISNMDPASSEAYKLIEEAEMQSREDAIAIANGTLGDTHILSKAFRFSEYEAAVNNLVVKLATHIKSNNVDILKAGDLSNLELSQLRLNQAGGFSLAVNELFESLSAIDENSSDNLNTLERLNYIATNTEENVEAVFESLEEDFFHVTDVSSEIVNREANKDIFEVNRELESYLTDGRTSEKMSTAKFNDVGFLEHLLVNSKTGTHFSQGTTLDSLETLIRTFEASKSGNRFTYSDTGAIVDLAMSIDMTHEFMRLTTSNLSFLGKLQRQISFNSSGNQVTYDGFSKGSNPELGVINDLVAPALYDVERMGYLEDTNQTNTDEYKSSLEIQKSLKFDEEKTQVGTQRLFSKRVNLQAQIDANLSTQKEIDLLKQLEAEIVTINSNDDLTSIQKANRINDLKSSNNYYELKNKKLKAPNKIARKQLASLEQEIASVEGDDKLSSNEKAAKIQLLDNNKIDEQLQVLIDIFGDNNYTVTDKQAVALNMLQALVSYVESKKDELSVVDYSSEIKETLNSNIELVRHLLETVKNKMECN